jgi:hypothetical protein
MVITLQVLVLAGVVCRPIELIQRVGVALQGSQVLGYTDYIIKPLVMGISVRRGYRKS